MECYAARFSEQKYQKPHGVKKKKKGIKKKKTILAFLRSSCKFEKYLCYNIFVMLRHEIVDCFLSRISVFYQRQNARRRRQTAHVNESYRKSLENTWTFHPFFVKRGKTINNGWKNICDKNNLNRRLLGKINKFFSYKSFDLIFGFIFVNLFRLLVN